MRHLSEQPGVPGTGPPVANPFDAVASTLREEVLAHCERNGIDLEGRAGWNTLETNSGFTERRGAPLMKMALERLKAPSLAGLRVLDVGCGFGALSVFFAFNGATVTGIDVNAGRLEVGRRTAERHGLDIELETQSMVDQALPDGSFDIAVMNNSLCYLAERELQLRALRAARAALTPGGVLVTRNPNRLHPIDQFTGVPLLNLLSPHKAVKVAARLGRRRSLCRLVSPRRARRELRESGFAGVVHHRNRPGWPPRPKLLTRYSHFTALRPEVRPLP